MNGKQVKWTASGIVTVLLFVVGWMFLVERRVSAIEANRFTSQDWIEQSSELVKRLERRMDRLEMKIDRLLERR